MAIEITENESLVKEGSLGATYKQLIQMQRPLNSVLHLNARDQHQ